MHLTHWCDRSVALPNHAFELGPIGEDSIAEVRLIRIFARTHVSCQGPDLKAPDPEVTKAVSKELHRW